MANDPFSRSVLDRRAHLQRSKHIRRQEFGLDQQPLEIKMGPYQPEPGANVVGVRKSARQKIGPGADQADKRCGTTDGSLHLATAAVFAVQAGGGQWHTMKTVDRCGPGGKLTFTKGAFVRLQRKNREQCWIATETGTAIAASEKRRTKDEQQRDDGLFDHDNSTATTGRSSLC